MNADIIIPIAFFGTVVVLALGVPLVRAYVRRQDAQSHLPPSDPELSARLARIEASLESVAIEVERISEGQRFTTKLLSERRTPEAAQALPAPSLDAGAVRRDAV